MLKAENKIHFTAIAFILLFIFLWSVVPSKPESLEASETKEGGLILSWIPPKNDGGSEIRYYNIYQLINDSQQQIGRVSSGINAYKVTNLSAGIKYRFEVLAGNSVGCGEPSVTTKTISNIFVSFVMTALYLRYWSYIEFLNKD